MSRATFPVVAHTLVFDDDGCVLLLRRFNTGFMDGYFGLPGGHLHEGETIADAAMRECAEEVGIRVTRVEPVVVMPFLGGVDFILHAAAWSGEPRIAEPDKCDAVAWSSPDELPENIIPFVAKALSLHRRGVWFHQYDDPA